MTQRYQDATLEQRRRWRKTWIDKCMRDNRCLVCGKTKEDGRRDVGKCKKCQKKQDINKKINPQIRPNGRKLMKSIHAILCKDCQPKLRDLESFWYDRRRND